MSEIEKGLLELDSGGVPNLLGVDFQKDCNYHFECNWEGSLYYDSTIDDFVYIGKDSLHRINGWGIEVLQAGDDALEVPKKITTAELLVLEKWIQILSAKYAITLQFSTGMYEFFQLENQEWDPVKLVLKANEEESVVIRVSTPQKKWSDLVFYSLTLNIVDYVDEFPWERVGLIQSEVTAWSFNKELWEYVYCFDSSWEGRILNSANGYCQ